MLLLEFANKYNQRRPHRSPEHHATAAVAYTTKHRPHAQLPSLREEPHHRIRHDPFDKSGTVSPRVANQLRHLDVGRAHAGTHVTLLIQELDVIPIKVAGGDPAGVQD